MSGSGTITREAVTAGSHHNHVLLAVKNPADFLSLSNEAQVVQTLMPDIVAAGLATNTQQQYMLQWNKFLLWASQKNRRSLLA